MKKVLLLSILSLWLFSCSENKPKSKTPADVAELIIGDWISTYHAFNEQDKMQAIPEEDAVRLHFDSEGMIKFIINDKIEYYDYIVSGKKITLKSPEGTIRFVIVIDSIDNMSFNSHIGVPSEGYALMKFNRLDQKNAP